MFESFRRFMGWLLISSLFGTSIVLTQTKGNLYDDTSAPPTIRSPLRFGKRLSSNLDSDKINYDYNPNQLRCVCNTQHSSDDNNSNGNQISDNNRTFGKNMWKNRIQNVGSNRTSAQTKSSNLSPFVSHSSVDSVGTSSISPKTGTELPSGVRYIRQTPVSGHRAVTGRTPSPSVAKPRERSPEKTLRFADPLMCTKKHERTETTKTIIKGRSASKERSRNLIHPVINTETNSGECKRFSSHNQKTIATSPATRQTSPIFSTVDFGGDKRTTTSTMTSNEDQITNSRNDFLIDSPDSVADSTPKLTHDRQPVIKTEIKTPNGTVLKRSSAVTSKTVNNGIIHRNTLSFPIQSSSDRNVEQSRLSVNVNVAVGLDCNDNQMNHFVDRKYYNEKDTELNAINQNEDEVDWQPVADPDSGFALRVAVRLRPFVESEINSRNNIPVIEMNGNTVRIVRSDNDNNNRMEYSFNVCLNSSDRDLFDYADQDIVFKKMGEPLLDRALEGYNVCLFAYGQTGSGKSFTITGSDTNPGIIPRFVHELYKRMLSLTEVLFAVEVSYHEIYNEKIYDLLSDDKNYNKKILRIREHPQTGPYVENLTQITVEDYDEVMHLLSSGNRRRATASTAANADSSRSHSIFTIILSQLKNHSNEIGLDMSCSCGSRINLIDLAGSERVGISSTSGDRLKEGSLINKSLLNLGKVITKLADYSAHPDRRTHIPYRDSALTWLLRESLGGNSQTSMIATISPAKCHLEETLSTLRYASTASRIVNFVHINEDPKSKKIRELMEIIAELKQKQNTNDVNNKLINTEVITSTHSSTDSQKSPQNVVKISKATNTSFVSSRETDSKGTDTSFADKVVEQPKKKTISIATNTSFIKPPQTCSTGTETPKIDTSTKPKTVSTATEMSFAKQIDTSTNTAFVELPSRLDLLRFQKLEEQQKKLIEDIRKHKEKILGDVNSKVDEWSHVGYVRPQGSEEEKSDTISDNYFDCEDINESIASNKTFVLSKDTVDQTSLSTTTTTTTTTVVTTQDTIQEGKPDKKKDKKDKKKKKKDKEKDKSNEWTAEEQNKSEVISNEKTEECDWNQDNDWGQEVNQTSNEKVDNQSNEWSVDPNAEQKASEPTTDEWGTDTQNTDNWDTQQTDENKDNETENKNKSEEDNNWGTDEWGTDDNKRNPTQDNNTGDDWNDDNQWSTEEPAKADETKEENNYWGTDTVDKSTEKNDNLDNKETEDSFDWGADPNDTTVIDTQEVKKESTDNWDTEENW